MTTPELEKVWRKECSVSKKKKGEFEGGLKGEVYRAGAFQGKGTPPFLGLLLHGNRRGAISSGWLCTYSRQLWQLPFWYFMNTPSLGLLPFCSGPEEGGVPFPWDMLALIYCVATFNKRPFGPPSDSHFCGHWAFLPQYLFESTRGKRPEGRTKTGSSPQP